MTELIFDYFQNLNIKFTLIKKHINIIIQKWEMNSFIECVFKLYTL